MSVLDQLLLTQWESLHQKPVNKLKGNQEIDCLLI